MSKEFYEGEIFMQDQLVDREVMIVAEGTLGPGNRGSFGPNSKREAEAALDYAKECYRGPICDESHCMDDRFEGFGVQLAGNRAITELAGHYMDPGLEELPLSRLLPRKVNELVQMGRTPYFHKGCAANAVLCERAALIYNAENPEIVIARTSERLRLLGVDTITHSDLEEAVLTGGLRAYNESLWDMTPEKIIAAARKSGAAYEEYAQAEHTAAGAGWNMSDNTFDNASFRHDHRTDDGQAQGMLSLTLGAYKKQLEEDGFSVLDANRRVMHATLYAVGVLKLALKEGTPDIIVGYSS